MPDSETIIREAPPEAFKCVMPVQMEFAKGDNENDAGGFKMLLYDGGVVDHYYWGNLAFDLATMKLNKPKIGVLYRHDSLLRLGVTQEATFDGKFIAKGKFLTNEDAQKIRNDADEGFPFEASLSIDRKLTKKIEQVQEGAVSECNGKKVKGPGVIMHGAVVDEVSICVRGALTNTKVTTFNEQFKESETMTEPQKKEEMTIEKLSKDYPEVYQAAVNIGEQNMRKEFKNFVDSFSDDPAFLVEQFSKGVTLQDAILAENKKLKASNQSDDSLSDETKNGNKVDAAESEFSDDQKKTAQREKEAKAQSDPSKFMSLARDYAEKNKFPLSQAVSQCTELYPKEHYNMLHPEENE